ncbi:LysR family transcriptional regulator [Sphingosinicella sp. BN140058]|uniref:LysR family transcriptional regulator n=1 Tax=Sphingosinicella sp. BN140058 TaxID=1892855 RepID=UPI0013EDC3AC|nr:LysR family transcriptional regulator [Sphingosinicella sp. BN140058]
MSFRSPPLETLRVFEACARHGSYTRAAAELGLSPAAVSQRMRNLHAELGTALFHRSGPRVALTDAGQRLAGRVREAMALLAAAVAECADPRILRVSATPTFASRWLAPRLTSFTEPHGLAVAIDPAIDLRAPGSFDIAIRSGFGDWQGYSATKLFPLDRTPLYNPRSYRDQQIEAPRDLLECQLIESDDWPSWFEAAGVPFSGHRQGTGVRYPTQDLAGTAAIEGGGVALLSPRLFQSSILAGQLVQPFDVILSGPEAYWLLIEEREARRSVLAFRDWLATACAANRIE